MYKRCLVFYLSRKKIKWLNKIIGKLQNKEKYGCVFNVR